MEVDYPRFERGGPSVNSHEPNKKRKLQYEAENFDLPSAKHRYRDLSNVADKSSENQGNPQNEHGQIHDRLAQPEKFNNNSNSPSVFGDNILNLDNHGREGESLFQNIHNLQTSAPSNSYTGFGHPAGLEDTLQSERRVDPEVAQCGMEFGDAAADDTVKYSNYVAPDPLLFSSEMWRGAQDGETRSREPTIDQEFEQYFSMLML